VGPTPGRDDQVKHVRDFRRRPSAGRALGFRRARGELPADASLAGHYYLHGVMEVGSELELKADGRFAYTLAYGALDELASGCWSRTGGVVTLNAAKFEISMEDPMKFERLELTVAPGGRLKRRFDREHAGAYSRN
jgi:hypothetical protein